MMGGGTQYESVFYIFPMSRSLPILATALVVLFVGIEPAASEGLGFIQRVTFWSLHVGIGLAGIFVASALIRHSIVARMALFVSIPVSGVLGAIIVTPGFLLLERFLEAPVPEPDSWLDHFAQRSMLHAGLAEFLEFTPVFVATWVAINLPYLFHKPSPNEPEHPGMGPGDGPDDGGGIVQVNETSPPEEPDRSSILAALPKSLGQDIVHISSDLHYLHVQTSLGKAMIIGNLRDAASALADQGMLVHRSHWVAHCHVVQYRSVGSEAFCVMSDGVRVPVSRRKRKAVKDQYGQGATTRPSANVDVLARRAG